MGLTERIERLDSGYDRVVRSDEERRRVYDPSTDRIKELLAWEQLVEKYACLVYSVARRCGLNGADADDVVRAVFTTLFSRLDGLPNQTRLHSWLITTTYQESRRVARASGHHVEVGTTIVDDQEPPAELVTSEERNQLVFEAMADLDDRCRDLLTALFSVGDGATYADIAERLGMPVGSIGPARARCFKKLEMLLRKAGVDDSRTATGSES